MTLCLCQNLRPYTFLSHRREGALTREVEVNAVFVDMNMSHFSFFNLPHTILSTYLVMTSMTENLI